MDARRELIREIREDLAAEGQFTSERLLDLSASTQRASRRVGALAAGLGVVAVGLLVWSVASISRLVAAGRELREATRQQAVKPESGEHEQPSGDRQPEAERPGSGTAIGSAPTDSKPRTRDPVARTRTPVKPTTAGRPRTSSPPKDPTDRKEDKPKPPPATLQPIVLLGPEAATGEAKSVPGRPLGEDGIQFQVPAFDAVVQLPQPLEGLLTLKLGKDRDSWVVRHRTRGLGEKDLLRCTRDAEHGRLLWTIPESAARGYSARIDCFVLLAVNRRAGLVYQCARRPEPIAREAVLRCKEDGSPAAGEAESRCTFAYPWPEALTVQHEALDDGKPVLLKELRRRSRRTVVIRRSQRLVVPIITTTRTTKKKKKSRGSDDTVERTKAIQVTYDLHIRFGVAHNWDKTTGAKKVAVSFSLLAGTGLSELKRAFASLEARLRKEKSERLEKAKDLAREKKRTEFYKRAYDRARAEWKAHGGSYSSSDRYYRRYKEYDSKYDAVRRKRVSPLDTEISAMTRQIKEHERAQAECKLQPGKLFADVPAVKFLDPWGLPVATVTPKVVQGQAKTR